MSEPTIVTKPPVSAVDALADPNRDTEDQSQAAKTEYVPPNGGYGWMCVLCCFLINTHTWGLNFAYGVFLDYWVAHNLYPGATALDYAYIGGLSVSMSLVITPLINISSRILGTKPTLTIGLALMTAALVGASFTTKVWQLYLSQGVCFGWSIGFLYVGSANIIPQWFSTRRSLANAMAGSGAGFGGLVYSLAANALIERFGVAWTFRALAICQFVAHSFSIIFIKDCNSEQKPNQSSFNYKLFARVEIWLMIGWGCLSEIGYTVLLFSLPNYARSVGLSPQQGSIVLACLNLSLFIGRPLVGYLSDKTGRINIATVTTGISGLVCLVIWIFAKSFGLLCFFALVAGLVCGTFWATVAPLTAEVTGLSEVPSTLGILLFAMVLPTTFAEAIGLSLKRPDGDIYLDAQIFTGCMFLGASLCTLLLRLWKMRQNDIAAVEQADQDEEPDIPSGYNSHRPSVRSSLELLHALDVV